jgi:hypothetical protein
VLLGGSINQKGGEVHLMLAERVCRVERSEYDTIDVKNDREEDPSEAQGLFDVFQSRSL